MYHSWVGRLALFFASVNIVLGVQAAGAGSDWRIGYGFLVSIVIVATIVLEVLAYLKRSEMRSLPPSFPMDPLQEPSFPSHLNKGVLFIPFPYIEKEKTIINCSSSIFKKALPHKTCKSNYTLQSIT